MQLSLARRSTSGLSDEEGVRIQTGFGLGFELSKYRPFGRLQDGIETANYGEGQNGATIHRLFVIAAQKFRCGPDERLQVSVIHNANTSFIISDETCFRDSISG